MTTPGIRQTRSRLSRTPARGALCCAALFCATAAFGYASDTSWAFLRFEDGANGWATTAHGTQAVVSWELNPKYSRSGRCLKVEYCLGSDCNLGDQNQDFWSNWNTGIPFTISNKYNTVGLWVKRDNSDLQDRDLTLFFRNPDLCSHAPIAITAADTAGRFIKIPMVCFRISFDPKDTARPMPAGEAWQTCLSVGARQIVVVNGVTHPKVPGSGTLWFDDIGLFYDPASPDFPGPYVPYNASVNVRQEAAPALRPVLSPEAGWTVSLFVRPAREPGRPVFDLTGRRAVTSAHVGETGVYVGRNGGLPGPGDQSNGGSTAAH